jgi:anti-sigma B factor antagonist
MSGEAGDRDRTKVTHERVARAPIAFDVNVHPERESARVVPIGELDISTADVLADKLRELEGAGFDRIVLDLRRLEFIDSTGLRLILERNAYAQANNHELALIAGPPAVQRIFDVMGLLDRLTFIRR